MKGEFDIKEAKVDAVKLQDFGKEESFWRRWLRKRLAGRMPQKELYGHDLGDVADEFEKAGSPTGGAKKD